LDRSGLSAEAGYWQRGELGIERQVAMKNSLEARRQQVMRTLEKINREIKVEEKRLRQIATRLAVLAQKSQRAA
jgi:hypothetical protein